MDLTSIVKQLWDSAQIPHASDRLIATKSIYLDSIFHSDSRSDNKQALDLIWTDLLLYRKLNARGFKWLHFIDKLVLYRLALTDDAQEFEKLLSQWWLFARTPDKRTPRSSKWKLLGEDQIEQITIDTLSLFAGDDAVTMYLITGDLEGALLHDEERIRNFKKRRDARCDKESRSWVGGDSRSLDYHRRQFAQRISAYYIGSKELQWNFHSYWQSIPREPK